MRIAEARTIANTAPPVSPSVTGVADVGGTGGARDRTHSALLEAGWTLLDGITVGEAVESLTAAQIATEAGRSERTFWNHFEDWDAYICELLAAIPRRGPMDPEDPLSPVFAVDDALTGASRRALAELIRGAAAANWEANQQPEELPMFRRQLFLISRSSAEPEIAAAVGPEYYGYYLRTMQQIYEATGAQAAVVPAPPLDWELLARVMAALTEGFLMQGIAAPDTVSADFVADVTATVALSLLTPAENPAPLGESAASFSGPETELVQDIALVELAEACRPLIAEQAGLRHWSQVAEVAGRPVAETRALARRLRVLEALAFTESDPFEAVDGGVDSTTRAFEGFCRLVRAARGEPVCAASLLAERVAPLGDAAVIRRLLPLGGALANALDESHRSHHERMVNVVLTMALSDTVCSPAEAAAAGLGVHPTLELHAG